MFFEYAISQLQYQNMSEPEWMPDPYGKVVPFGHTHEESQQSL